MADTLLLSLETTQARRHHFKVDGKPYFLKALDELSIRDRACLRQAIPALQKGGGPGASLEEAGAADEAVDALLRAVVSGCDGVILGLSQGQKAAVLAAFFGEMNKAPLAAETGEEGKREADLAGA